MAGQGRNQPCRCESGRTTKRCCGVRTGPSEEELARAALSSAAQTMALVLIDHSDAQLTAVAREMRQLPSADLSLLVPLPRLHDASLQRLCRAVAEDDLEQMLAALPSVVEQVDTAALRVQMARALLALVERHGIETDVAAAAVIDLASDSRTFLRASLLEAVAIAIGAAPTPSGLLVAIR